MGDEKREILNMLSEGKLSVDEAMRLMSAVDEGRQKTEAAGTQGGGRRREGVQEAMHSLKETMAGIGPLVGRIAGEISTEFQRDQNFPGESEAEELPPLDCEDGRFEIRPGDRLYIRCDKKDGPGAGDLQIEGCTGGHCEVEGGDALNLRFLQSSSGPVVRWSGGLLKLRVPESAAEVFAYTLGGDLRIGDLHCPVQAKSMGGDLRLRRLSRRFKVKTMGGNIRLLLGAGDIESSEVKTMGGNVRIEVEDGMSETETEAVTMGGSIIVENEFGVTRKGGNIGKQKVKLTLGEGDPRASLRVKTMGGNIEIRRARDEF